MEAAALEARYRFKRMVARAYHDSSFVACIAPVAMLFIPCRGGVSHRPDEFASREWIGAGVDVLHAPWRSWQAKLFFFATPPCRCMLSLNP